jgi:hypothetical protein
VPAPSFAEVLDDALARARVHARRAVTWSAAAGAREAGDPFVFARPLSSGAAWTRGYPQSAAPPPPPPRARVEDRRLSVAEQHALAQLVTFGALLTESFSAGDLKREYRRLALRHHPDRRRAGAGQAVTDASTTFAAIAEAYRCLRRVVEPRH